MVVVYDLVGWWWWLMMFVNASWLLMVDSGDWKCVCLSVDVGNKKRVWNHSDCQKVCAHMYFIIWGNLNKENGRHLSNTRVFHLSNTKGGCVLSKLRMLHLNVTQELGKFHRFRLQEPNCTSTCRAAPMEHHSFGQENDLQRARTRACFVAYFWWNGLKPSVVNACNIRCQRGRLNHRNSWWLYVPAIPTTVSCITLLVI